jgi:glycosyltransferase involved in cell wall biosynthesis
VLYLAMGLFSKGVAYSSLQHAATDVGFNELAEHVTQVWLYTKGSLNLYKDALSGHDLDNLVLGMSAVLDMAQPRDIVFLVQFPGWAPLALRLRERFGGRLVFDCMDDHGGFSTNTRSAIKAEEELIERSDLVITSSHLLMEKARAFNENTLLVMNGTEFEHFHQPLPNGELDHLRGHPIIGYYGAISDWFDLDLVIYCARERPTWFFLLIGEIHGCDVSATQQLPNVLFLGEKPYRELPGYLAYFDVCTIPFKIMPLTLATNPVKFYEYLSSGKPVVAVDLPELLPYQNDCYIALNREEFLAKLEQALQTKDRKDLQARRIALAKENSWDARVADILSHPVFASA